MKRLIFTFFLLLFSCSSNKTVYWCGDHACINKKEKESYFKKTMSVEKKLINKKDEKNYSLNEKLIKQVKQDEKERIKNEKALKKELKLERKTKIKEQKELAKKLKLEQKNKIKAEKELTKKLSLEKKRRIKKEKKLVKGSKSKTKIDVINKQEFIEVEENIMTSVFTELKEKIIKRNMVKPYPDLNNINN